jgi:hypothetical protein
MSSESLESKESLVTKLREEIKSLGTYFEMRRRAAFAGLLQLGEYASCVEAIAEESPSSLHWLAEYHDTDVIVTRMLFEHWEKLHEASRIQSRIFEIPWGALIYDGSAREAFSNSIARAQLVDHLKTMKPQDRSPSSLALMAELLPNSAELRTYLIESFNKSYRNDTPFEAQRIFAEQFGGDEQALIELQKFWVTPGGPAYMPEPHLPFLYALALGWPHSPLLRPYLEEEKLPKDLPIITTLALCHISGNNDHALACINTMIKITLKDGRALPDLYPQNLLYWARSPNAEPLLRRLIDDRDSSRKITAINLLASIGKLTDEDCTALVQQFNEVLRDTTKSCPDGVDLVKGTVATLPQAIFRVLTPGLSNGVRLR